MVAFILAILAALCIFLALLGVSIGVELVALGLFFLCLAVAAMNLPLTRRV